MKSFERKSMLPSPDAAASSLLDTGRAVCVDDTAVGTLSRRVIRACSFLWGIVAFFPYPAFAVGQNTGLQVGNILGLLFLVFCFKLFSVRHGVVWLLFVFVSALSLLIAGLNGEISVNLVVGQRVFLVWSLFTSSLLITGMFLQRYSVPLVKGIASAVILHSLVGLYQIESFKLGQIPFEELYNNPSFASLRGLGGASFALYVKRPFGIFPEPSAMAASIAPWVLLFLSHMLGLVKIFPRLTIADRVLACAVVILGMPLLYSSRSGLIVFVSVAIAALVVVWAKKQGGRFTRIMVFPMIGLLTSYAVIHGTQLLMGERVEESLVTGASWHLRGTSITKGLELLVENDPVTFLFGVGTGQASTLMRQSHGLDAVWSLFFNSIVENGFAMILVWSCLFVIILRDILRSKRRSAGVVFFGVWFAGIAFATSYSALLPLWISLGWLLAWRRTTEVLSD